MWRAGTNGLFMRSLDSTGDAQGNVASSNIQISKYTDTHEVDEDMMTISNYGGWWHDNALVGIAYRTLYDSPSTITGVASLKNKD